MERPSSLAAGCFFIALLLLLTLARPLHAQEEAGAYTVAPGDTLGAIAAQLGVSLDALITANAIDDPNHIRVGQVLLVPNADGTMPAAAVAAITTTAIVRAAAGDTLATLAARYELDPALVAELNGRTDHAAALSRPADECARKCGAATGSQPGRHRCIGCASRDRAGDAPGASTSPAAAHLT
jgi:LysM repeat protein